ncbi:MAG TPA: BadF/BadG/BcrA/BcrD ATPase family protein [Gemmatimonadales bacterium]|nr:BadF/BadG/BcrA/BcrD ATPase family protein [Gemmatimonadales bacterium]
MILVGIDAGGSKTAAAVWDGETRLAAQTGAAGAVRPGRALAASATIADVARQALAAAGRSRADVLVVGAAGVGRPTEREELTQALRGEGISARVVVVTDIELVLAAAFGGGPGIALAAGTGSIAVMRNGDGALHRSGGLGWQMGDEGSGYAIGRAALAAVGAAHDGRGPATALAAQLPGAARVPDFDALVAWAAVATPTQVASLAPVVLGLAGDAVASGIVKGAANDLARLVGSLVERVRPAGVLPLTFAGSLLARAGFRSLVLAALQGADGVAPQDGVVDPLAGARALAG